MAKTCPSCGAPIDATATTCPYCGAVIPQEEKQIVEQPATPIIIQQQISSQRPKKHDRNKTTAALLAFFLGCFGADQFYIGNTIWGLVLLLITICSVGFGLVFTGVVALINFIKFLVMSEDDFDNKYNY